jgi:hypothetical protein
LCKFLFYDRISINYCLRFYNLIIILSILFDYWYFIEVKEWLVNGNLL